MSRKNERLVNLTIALLATKRYLTKNEIFRNVEGYEGNIESIERMFERDKDDLRKIGISIEVGGLDPLFDDEAGYRIRPESYALSLQNLNPTQIALLSLAAQAWSNAAFNDISQLTLRKFNSIGIETDLTQLPVMAPKFLGADENLRSVFNALNTLTAINFTYLNSQGLSEERSLHIYGLQTRKSHWFIVGMDLVKNEIRNFRLDRIIGDISTKGAINSYAIPADFKLLSLENEIGDALATLKIRPGSGYSLRRLATKFESSDDLDLVELPIISEDYLVNLILWHGEDVIVISPPSLRAKVIAELQKVVASHG